ncbi:MAG: MotA/TolQ/ExbB proton channel family protein, partial [Cyanobacteria bacterium J06629_18]
TGGISEALVSTAAGLVVAIFTLLHLRFENPPHHQGPKKRKKQLILIQYREVLIKVRGRL